MQSLPEELINKISLYLSSPTAQLIKDYYEALDGEYNIWREVEGYEDEESDQIHFRIYDIDYPRIHFRSEQLTLKGLHDPFDVSWITHTAMFSDWGRTFDIAGNDVTSICRCSCDFEEEPIYNADK